MMLVLRTIVLVFLCLVFSHSAFTAEVENLNDLLTILDTAKSDSVKIHTEVKLANYYIYRQLDSAEYYIDLVLDNPRTEGVLPKGFYLHKLIKAWVYQGNGKLRDAKKYMQEANLIVSDHNNRKASMEIKLNLASILVDLKDEEAIDFIDKYLVFLDTTSQVDDEKLCWLLAKQLKARSLSYRGDFKSALEEMVSTQKASFIDKFPQKKFGTLKAISIYLKKIGDLELSEKYLREAIAQPIQFEYEHKFILFHLSELFIATNRIDSCQFYLEKANKLRPFNNWECYHYFYLQAKMEYNRKDYPHASTHIAKAKNCAKDMQDNEIKLQMLLLEASILCKKDDWVTVKNLLSECQQIIQQNPILNTLDIKTTLSIISLKIKLRKYDKNLIKDVEQVVELNKEKNQLVSDKKLKEIMVKFQATQKEQENQLLKKSIVIEKEKSRYKTLGIVGASIVTILSLLLLFFYRKLLKITKKYNDSLITKNLGLKSDNQSLEKDKGVLLLEKEALIFEKEELTGLNTELQEQIKQHKSNPPPQPLSDIQVVGINKTHLVDPATIKYVTAYQDGSQFNLTADLKDIWSPTKFKDTLRSLEKSSQFVQIGRSTIINKSHVESIASNFLTTNDGEKHKIGRTYKKQITDWINKNKQ